MSFDNIDSFVAEFEEQKKQFSVKMQGEFKKMVTEFFDACPDVKSIVWVQYTPYFNDGSPCVFGIGDVTFSNADPENVSPWGELEDEEEGLWAASYGYKEYLAEPQAEYCDKFSRMVNQLDGVMQEMFGDHVRINVTREGFDVEEYIHD